MSDAPPASTTTSATNERRQAPCAPGEPRRIVLLGNPNTGKTTLFNRLCGLRHKTANFPGTTLESRLGVVRAGSGEIRLDDLPGVYSIELDQHEARVCRLALEGSLALGGESVRAPDAVCVVLDATSLPRNLRMLGEALRRRLPMIVAVNMIDIARRRGIVINTAALERELGCPVVPVSGRTGEGVEALVAALERPRLATTTPPGDPTGERDWVERLAQIAEADTTPSADTFTERLDLAFTHPVVGLAVFALVMTGVFWALFRLATIPMDLIDSLFTSLGGFVASALPDGLIASMLVDGVIPGVGGVAVFLPQICLLFFLFSLLEDTGYLARASFVADRVLRPFGLPGHAFIPLLSSHACALPGIMAARAIPDRRERLATILVAPFMTCSARLPVYVLLTSLLFKDSPAMAALAFTGCYALGACAGVVSALIFRRTILRGEGRPMALELPSYKRPSVRDALMNAWDRGLVFARNAGSVILSISIVLWWLAAYPVAPPTPESAALREQAAALVHSQPAEAGALITRADSNEAQHRLESSFAGMLGRAVEPALAPIGYDWRISIGVLSSFAAREVFVSTMAVVLTGHEDADSEGVLGRIRQAKRDDGVTPVLTRATAWSLLVFFVLAMQCLPTLVVTAREAGGWKWAALQFAWMTGVAYAAALTTFTICKAMGIA
ncbi:MAG: ferrous iron transporter B [Phycisphaeraceae bacterium]|nr:ferrous iron transporter B [Phycisphaeraceae bacterium]MCB9847814.1 ferrous iron transporter B [Phycisphaeraceae bacterium]